MKRKIIAGLIALTALAAGCASKLYVPTSADGRQQGQLLRGRKLYVSHCGSCHNLHLPKEYDTDQWIRNVDEMQAKAKITGEEKQLILQYLTYRH